MRSDRPADRREALRVAAAAAAVLAALLAAPGTAPAAVSCRFSEVTHVMSVDLTATNDTADLIVAASGEIVVEKGGGGQIACTGGMGPPTNTSTDIILVASQPGAANPAVVIHDVSRFGPGVAGEAGGTREIEISVDLNAAPGTLLLTDDSATIRMGSLGINPNAFAAEVLPDADIFYSGVRVLAAVGANDRADTLGAQGGAGTGGALAGAVLLSGQSGADSLTGGDGPDLLAGGDGNDHLSGGGGDDAFEFGSGGDDVVDGGPGTDTVSYLDDGPSVSVDLAITGAQPTGAGNDTLANIENLVGTRGADVLRGDGGPNQLFGNDGPDVLEGRGGQDLLDGGQDADSLDLRDGGPDLATCGAGIDTATADPPGVDILSGCETVAFAPVNTGAGTGTTAPSQNAGSTTPSANAGAAPADRLAPSFLGQVKADPPRFQVARATARATTFRYALTEAATVTIAIERRISGRKVKGSCRAAAHAHARKPSCARYRRIGSLHAPAHTGANATPFSGRITSRALTPGPYRAVLRAVDAAGNRSTRATARFTVLRPSGEHRRP